MDALPRMIRLLTCIAGALASWSAPPLLAQPDAVSEVDQLPSASSGFGLQPLQLGGQLFRLGGYLETVAADTLEEPARLGLDRISLIGSWQSGGAWSGLLEVEMKQLVRLQPGNSSVEEGRPVLERAYLDYAHADALQIRVGKLLTPIGRWNPLHAAPLTWTTSRPLITEDTFPTNATGAMLRGVVPVWGQALEWSLWASPGEELFPEARAQTFNEAYGLRLAQDLGPHWQLGLSVADYEEDGDPTRKTLYSADFRFAASGWELSGEFAHRVLSRTTQRADEEGLYLQAVAPLSSRWFMVLRHESFDSAGASDDLHLTLGGLTLRWSRSLVGKLEYRRATENAAGVPEGWLGSLAVMF
jgi:hypothetical protein